MQHRFQPNPPVLIYLECLIAFAWKIIAKSLPRAGHPALPDKIQRGLFYFPGEKIAAASGFYKITRAMHDLHRDIFQLQPTSIDSRDTDIKPPSMLGNSATATMAEESTGKAIRGWILFLVTLTESYYELICPHKKLYLLLFLVFEPLCKIVSKFE